MPKSKPEHYVDATPAPPLFAEPEAAAPPAAPDPELLRFKIDIEFDPKTPRGVEMCAAIAEILIAMEGLDGAKKIMDEAGERLKNAPPGSRVDIARSSALEGIR